MEPNFFPLNPIPWRRKCQAAATGFLVTTLAMFSLNTHAQMEAPVFQACLESFQALARERRLPASIVDEVIPELQVQNRVLELDQRQPEFMQTFGQYLDLRLTEARIERGRQELAQKSSLLAQLRQEFGVPGHYLMAFWGLETNFGGYLGTMPTLDSLATLACDPRRSAFFTGEFLTALELMHREQFTPEQMQGSWAGAVGHTQFMPSSYLQYAIDGDDDGTIDLWRSEADALASGAHFLQQLGWVPNLRWGREVLLPADFDFSLAGRSQKRPLSDWSRAGVTSTRGTSLPSVDIDAAVLVPAGSDGPAFLVYENFEIIMKWNRSESYALSVGLLADLIAGGPGLTRQPPDGDSLRLEEIKELQLALAHAGFDPGPADGVWGPATRKALSGYEKSTGRIADGYPDNDVRAALLREVPQTP